MVNQEAMDSLNTKRSATCSERTIECTKLVSMRKESLSTLSAVAQSPRGGPVGWGVEWAPAEIPVVLLVDRHHPHPHHIIQLPHHHQATMVAAAIALAVEGVMAAEGVILLMVAVAAAMVVVVLVMIMIDVIATAVATDANQEIILEIQGIREIIHQEIQEMVEILVAVVAAAAIVATTTVGGMTMAAAADVMMIVIDDSHSTV
jgi:hypothetical protein